MKKIIIDKKKCIGCYQCKNTCYSVFEVGSDGKAKVRYGISQADIEDAETAGINCPTGAISIVETHSNSNFDSSFLGIVNSILDWAESSDNDK